MERIDYDYRNIAANVCKGVLEYANLCESIDVKDADTSVKDTSLHIYVQIIMEEA